MNPESTSAQHVIGIVLHRSEVPPTFTYVKIGRCINGHTAYRGEHFYFRAAHWLLPDDEKALA
jgi:hypothetical protein